MCLSLSAVFGAWLADVDIRRRLRLCATCVARVDRRVTGERVCLRTTRWQVAMSEGESRTARTRPQRSGGRIAQARSLLNRCRAGFGCVYKPGWLWPLRMAKRVSERATRGGEHGGIGTPHARGASGEILGVGSEEVSSISFCLRARWLVSSLTRRRGGPPALRPSGRGPGYGGASEREIGPPNPVGGGFVSGI